MLATERQVAAWSRRVSVGGNLPKAEAEELLASHEELRAGRTQLEAWTKAFGTTQLTHAKARLDSAESKARRLEAENERIRRLLETAEAVVRKLAGSPERIRTAVDEGMVYPEVAELFTAYLDERREGS